MGIDLDRDLEMDAVALQLFAGKEGKSKGVQIMQGEVKITLFDGIIQPGTSELPPVLKEWKYSSEDYDEVLVNISLGRNCSDREKCRPCIFRKRNAQKT